MYKAIIWSGSLALLALAYHFEAIAGRWRFDRFCTSEGGSSLVKSQVRLQQNRAWEVMASDPLAYQVLLASGSVAFVRFRDPAGVLLDMYPASVPNRDLVRTANEAKPVDYRLTIVQEVMDDVHIRRTRHTVTTADQRNVLAQHTSFSYVWSSSDRPLLSSPPPASCYAGADLKTFLTTTLYGVEVAAKSP
jgi:hypothetical protein